MCVQPRPVSGYFLCRNHNYYGDPSSTFSMRKGRWWWHTGRNNGGTLSLGRLDFREPMTPGGPVPDWVYPEADRDVP